MVQPTLLDELIEIAGRFCYLHFTFSFYHAGCRSISIYTFMVVISATEISYMENLLWFIDVT